MTNEPLDPLMDALSVLRPLVPRESHTGRVRRRCHQLLADRRARRQNTTRQVHPADMMVATAVVLYLVSVVSEALRLLGSTTG